MRRVGFCLLLRRCRLHSRTTTINHLIYMCNDDTTAKRSLLHWHCSKFSPNLVELVDSSGLSLVRLFAEEFCTKTHFRLVLILMQHGRLQYCLMMLLSPPCCCRHHTTSIVPWHYYCHLVVVKLLQTTTTIPTYNGQHIADDNRSNMRNSVK